MPGDPPDSSLVNARRGLLDAVEALRPHLGRAVLVGAQAIYLHVSEDAIGVALFTKDADVALLPPLTDEPDIEDVMRSAGFSTDGQPGIWRNDAVQVDLLVPEGLAPHDRHRSARLAGHGRTSARKVAGLEAVAVDCGPMIIGSLDTRDPRQVEMSVAGPGALLIAKLYKLGERAAEKGQRRLESKDAHDVYRLLRLPTADLATRIQRALDDPRSADVARFAIEQLSELFQAPEGIGSRLAGDYLGPVGGDPLTVAASVSALANDLLIELARNQSRV